MWYAVQTPAGREAEMAEKLNRVYSGESDKPCFVLSKEIILADGRDLSHRCGADVSGYIFVDTDDAGELETEDRNFGGILRSFRSMRKQYRWKGRRKNF